MPVALLGLIGYVLILGSLLAPEEERFRFATAVLVLGGFGFSVYLTYREVFSLEKICEYCVSSAILLTLMLPLALWRFLKGSDTVPAPGDDAGGDAGGESSAALGSAT